MRWSLRLLVCGVLAAGFCTPVHAQGGKGAKPNPGLGLVKPSEAETCGDYGTSIHFEKSPKEAAAKAAKLEKLVFVVHISGVFEDSALT